MGDLNIAQARWTAAGAALAASAASMKLLPSARRALVAGGATFAIGMLGILMLEAAQKSSDKRAERAEET